MEMEFFGQTFNRKWRVGIHSPVTFRVCAPRRRDNRRRVVEFGHQAVITRSASVHGFVSPADVRQTSVCRRLMNGPLAEARGKLKFVGHCAPLLILLKSITGLPTIHLPELRPAATACAPRRWRSPAGSARTETSARRRSRSFP